MATMHMEYKDNTSILKVEGALSIQDASALRDCLLKALGLAESLLIDLSGAEAIDLACLQVLCSAHKTYSLTHKGIRMAGELPEGVVRSLFQSPSRRKAAIEYPMARACGPQEGKMGKKILSVDDSASIRQLVTFTLQKEGYEVVEAVDGQDALVKVKSRQWTW